MTKKDLVWRLKERPTADDIVKLIDAKVITAEEAKTIAFNSVDENDKITKLEQEVELLKNALKDMQHGVPITRSVVGQYTNAYPLVDPFRLFRGIIDL